MPAHLLFLASLPLTANGKLDRKALPQPQTDRQGHAYVAPEGEREQQVAAIWAQVLDVERVGRSDDFFALGGHSLLATQVVARVRQQLAPGLKLRALFDHPRLDAFVACLGHDEQARPALPLLQARAVSTQAPLALVQRRLWVVEQVAHACGYQDVGTFRRIFTRATGQRPADYRAQHRLRTSRRRWGGQAQA